MKVILLSNVENVGLAGDVAAVKNGYFRNFLNPRRMAVEATPGNLKMMESRRKKLRAEAEKIVQEAKQSGEKLREVVLNFKMKAGSNDRLFGSVSAADIADALTAKDFPVDKRQVVIPYAIKEVGVFSATIKVHTHVHVPVKVVVEKEQSEEELAEIEAERQAAEAEAAEAAEAAEGGETADEAAPEAGATEAVTEESPDA